jgi:ferredoxin-nitrate reductase
VTSLPARVATAACPYCGVGCLLDVTLGDDGRVASIRGNQAAQANRGKICPKGALLGETIDAKDRLTTPLLRVDDGGVFIPISWDVALDLIATNIRKFMLESGRDSVAFYGSGQLDTEAWYAAGKLFKGALGTNNTDSNSRLCMASAVAGYRSSLGSDGPPTSYEDIDVADVILIIGSNMAEAHPVLFDRVKAHKRRDPGVTVVVIDPRRTPTAEFADIHIQLKPGSDIALLNALASRLIANGAVDQAFADAHCSGFAEYSEFVSAQPLCEAEAISGVSTAEIDRLARIMGEASNMLSLYCMGTNQSTVGMWKNNSVINLHLLLGQIGKPGAGPFSLTGQPNAMGGRESGALAHMLPGYRLVEDEAHRAEIEEAWGLPAGRIAPQMGLTAVEMFRALEHGALRMLWIAATNPAVSMPDLHQAKRALAAAEFVVVQDIYHPTETSQLADLVLPAAGWGEKDGTSTNSERTISYSGSFLAPAGDSRPDWWILAEVGRRIAPELFPWATSGEIWDEFRTLTAGRPCDMAGATRTRLEADSVQWPCPAEGHPGSLRRYEGGIFPTPDGRARFLARPHQAPREQTDHEFPLVLTTGRISSQWHSRTRTGKVAKLVNRDPEPYIEIHPTDAAARGVADGDIVHVSSRRGFIRVKARMGTAVAPGCVFAPFHWGDSFARNTAANYLTNPVIGRIAKEPEFKYCAVQVVKRDSL